MAARRPGAAGADDHRVVRVGGRHVDVPGHFDGSNVNTMIVPRTNSAKPSM